MVTFDKPKILQLKFTKTTEQDSKYRELEKMKVSELISNINNEDKTVAFSVEKSLPQIEKLIEQVVKCLVDGGRLFYIGAGTSGRLGIVDASECPPTFGVPHSMVIGLIAGGDSAIRKAVEFAEDSTDQGWQDLQEKDITVKDIVIGIAASGTTPYVIGALAKCNESGIMTGCISCNENSPLGNVAQFAVEVVVGPEFVTGSSRMKAGTAQKMVLNMITTAAMIKLGRVVDNKMVDMQLSNNKLVDRGIKMVKNSLNISDGEAKSLIEKHGGVRLAIDNYGKEN